MHDATKASILDDLQSLKLATFQTNFRGKLRLSAIQFRTLLNKVNKVAFKLQLRMISLYRYQTESGQEPITNWLNQLRDKRAQAKL
ncbi:MAG: hypothetical protein PHV02_11050, partial [Rhodocyclaceae bacterium]|nr:hypothetical protein [Rhodocyclaceae bacterium]